MNNDDFRQKLPQVLEAWGYGISEYCPELEITGSPERAVYRTVVCSAGELLVVEAVAGLQKRKRENQCRCLHFLESHGASGIEAWRLTRSGECGIELDGYYWQLRRYVSGTPLPRETYGNDGWRGLAAADFLLKMRIASDNFQMPLEKGDGFLLGRYIERLMPLIGGRIPSLVADIKPIITELEEYFAVEPSLCVRYCHGDFHPGNIIWGEAEAISAVIDWEFAGKKPAGYDLANMLGCLGMDDPAYLTGAFALELVRTLRRNDFLDELCWYYLPELIISLRFGWLREWVVRRNIELICQELDFIWLIMDNRGLLRNRYSLS